MVRKESGTKAFVLCMVAFWLGVLCVMSMGCHVGAEIRVAKIDYVKIPQRLEPEHKIPPAKSCWDIIREILDRKMRLPEMPDMDNTIPIPLYDTPDWEKMKNFA
mgnify:CR=1 FL=1